MTIKKNGHLWQFLINEKPFTNCCKGYGLDKQKAIWKATPLRENDKEDCRYIEGLQKLGDDIVTRHRDKSKEVNSS